MDDDLFTGGVGSLVFLYVLFTRILFKNNLGHQESTAEFIRNKIKQLGVWSVAEKRVMGVFVWPLLCGSLKIYG